ncbi:MAG: hypothetical protein IKR08_05490 [Firmicutes bacterium]|jgi:hypothetical protein|nr:hypothetical protein [Bacillota bacterium]
MKIIFAVLCILCLAVLVLAGIKSFKYKKGKFTVAELLAQGKAFKVAFYSMMAYAVIYALLDTIGIVWCETVSGLLFGVLIGAAVYIMAAIHFDGYASIQIHDRLWFYISLIMIVLSVVSVIMSIVHGTLIVDKKLGTGAIGIFVILLWAAIIVVQHFHYGVYEEEEETEEESSEE